MQSQKENPKNTHVIDVNVEEKILNSLEALTAIQYDLKLEIQSFLKNEPYAIQQGRLRKVIYDESNRIKTSVYDSGIKILHRLNIFYEQIHTLETIFNSKQLSKRSVDKAELLFTKLYGFYLNYYSILYALDESQNDQYVQKVIHKLSSQYSSLTAMHDDEENELYLGRAFCYSIKSALDQSQLLPSEETLKGLKKSIDNFSDFIDNIKNKEIKTACLMQFIIFNSHPISRSLPLSMSKNKDQDLLVIYGKKILRLTQHSKDKINMSLFHLFSEASNFYSKAYNLNLKLKCNEIEAFFKLIDVKVLMSAMPLKNTYKTVVEHLKIIYPNKNMSEAFDFIISHTNQIQEQPFDDLILFQNNEIVFKLLAFYDQGLKICEQMFSQMIEGTPNEKIESWRSVYELLNLQKSILEDRLKLYDILALYHQHIPEKEKTNAVKKLKKVIEQLYFMNSCIEKSDINFKKLLREENQQDKLDQISAKKLKKRIAKEQELRKSYLETKKHTSHSIIDKDASVATKDSALQKDPIELRITEANQLLTDLKFKDAAIKFMEVQQVVNDPLSIHHINAEIGIGDAFKNLTSLNSDQELQRRYQNKAYLSYQNAYDLTNKGMQKKSLETPQIHDYCALKDIAETLVVKHKNYATLNQEKIPESSYRIVKQQPDKISQNERVEKNIPLKIQKQSIPQVEIITTIPLPMDEMIRKLSNLLLQSGYFVAITGGYNRDFFLNIRPHDVDLVIFKLDFKQLGNESTLLTAYDIIKQHFENCEMRGGKYPNIFLQNKNTILEITTLKIENLAELINCKLTEELLLKLLFNDAKKRDTTDNAIFYDMKNNRFIDFFKGIKDIRKNRIRLIQTPQKSLTEDALRIFRIIRFICQRVMQKDDVSYHQKIINSIKDQITFIKNENMDRCYVEIKKLFFRGCALETWNFLERHNIIHNFFLLPQDTNYIHSTHYQQFEIMLKLTFSKIDHWFEQKKEYEPALFFAAVYWGIIQESLLKKSHSTYGFGYFISHVDQLFNRHQHLFNMPPAIFSQIKIIWYIHLSKITGYSFDQTLSFNLNDYRTAKIFSNFMTQAMKLLPEKNATDKATTLGLTKNRFYHHSSVAIIQQLKEIIKLHDFSVAYTHNSFTMILPDKSIRLTRTNQHELINSVKKKLQILLGQFAIYYDHQENKLLISTNSVYKHRATREILEEIFDIEMPYKSEIIFSNAAV